jgi:hypothetical protein
VLIQKRSIQPFGDAIALRPAHLGGSVLDTFELQEQLVGVLVRPAAELPAIVA